MENWNPEIVFAIAYGLHRERVTPVDAEGWMWTNHAPELTAESTTPTAMLAVLAATPGEGQSVSCDSPAAPY